MLLKPATPLSALLFIAFALLLLSVLSTPLVKQIPLATHNDLSFGVFGWCRGTECSPFTVGYKGDGKDGAFDPTTGDSDFNLPPGIRYSLSSLLIVHPIAAFLTLVCFGLAAAAHLHSPSHSPRYLLGLLILLLPTLLVSLLAFLVDILLFVPHLQWGGWIVLAATIILTTSGILTCAMRRTLVSRKARKRRIAENAEMSGENFYNRQNAMKLDPPSITNVGRNDTNSPTVPIAGSIPTFATFESTVHSTEDDTRLLNSRSPARHESDSLYQDPKNARFWAPASPEPKVELYQSSRDEISAHSTTGAYPTPYSGPSDSQLRNQYSNSSMGSYRGGISSYSSRGRGAPPSSGRMGGPPSAGRGRPPPGYGSGRPYAQSRGTPYDNGPYLPRQPSSGGRYGPPRPPGEYNNTGYQSSWARGPAPIPRSQQGQEIEMEQSPGNSYHHSQGDETQHNTASIPRNTEIPNEESTYIPARSDWAKQEPTLPVVEPVVTLQAPSPVNPTDNYYEDMDPRFVDPSNPDPTNVPRTLTPGGPSTGELLPRPSLDDLPDGARSPAVSETSHFTSISQRGVNPKWRPQRSDSATARKQKRRDVLLGSNPDFELSRNPSRPGGRMPPMPAMPSTVPGNKTQ